MAEEAKSKTPEQIREDVKASLPSLDSLIKGENGPKVVYDGKEKAPNEEIPEKKAESTLEKPENTQKEEKSAESTEKERDYEAEAREMDWVPKEEYNGNPKSWVTAKEWVERAPLIERITGQKDTIRTLVKDNRALAKAVKNLMDNVNKQREESLLTQRNEAIQEGNVEAFNKFDKQYNDIKQETEQISKELPHTSGIEPETEEFIERNKKWFNDTPENIPLKEYAIQIEKQLMITRPELSLENRLKETERIVKEDPRYINKFSNPKRDRPPTVEGNTPAFRPKTKITFEDCPSDVKRIYRQMKKAIPELDLDKVAQDLLDTGAIKYE